LLAFNPSFRKGKISVEGMPLRKDLFNGKKAGSVNFGHSKFIKYPFLVFPELKTDLILV
jgi:hypothetical protein